MWKGHCCFLRRRHFFGALLALGSSQDSLLL
ncbi:hypothetical protein HU200_038196 [Digitaria exilis]|uniref:Uncharacterized protein n=1 Tax=Digitaria exilis TaxID=1010633 RepID=A0A835EM13_9POAL|nr:hypothetical protein HU200_038196 [Digitaria exilis]